MGEWERESLCWLRQNSASMKRDSQGRTWFCILVISRACIVSFIAVDKESEVKSKEEICAAERPAVGARV
jgi:hypothetical protein